MSMLNSRSIQLVVREQMLGAPIIRKLKVECSPAGYIIVAWNEGWRGGRCECIPVTMPRLPSPMPYAAQYMGMGAVYLGSRQRCPQPVPEDMIRAVREAIDIPLLVGGGIRDAETAARIKRAGDSIVVTGTIVENGNYHSRLDSIIKAIKN